jgi:hypothetical protein
MVPIKDAVGIEAPKKFQDPHSYFTYHKRAVGACSGNQSEVPGTCIKRAGDALGCPIGTYHETGVCGPNWAVSHVTHPGDFVT